jgi:hypothetical protein
MVALCRHTRIDRLRSHLPVLLTKTPTLTM